MVETVEQHEDVLRAAYTALDKLNFVAGAMKYAGDDVIGFCGDTLGIAAILNEASSELLYGLDLLNEYVSEHEPSDEA